MWDDAGTRKQLASAVIKVKAIRGWKNVNFPDKDQGIIAAYIKTDGKVYYSSYCQTVDYTYVWEPERQLVEFTGSALSLNMFITNDFRMGFSIEDSSNKIHWLVTERNWAGLAIAPGKLTAQVGKTDIVLTRAKYHNLYSSDERIKGSTSTIVNPLYAGSKYSVIDIINIDSGTGNLGTHIKLSLTHHLSEINLSEFIVGDSLTGDIYQCIGISMTGFREYTLEFIDFNLIDTNDIVFTCSGKKTKNESGGAIDSFVKVFKPVGLVPPQIPIPEVEEVWNE